MSNTIDNFLVGLGFKYDDKGVKHFGNALGNIKSKALQLGAVLGTSFAAKSLIFDKSEYADNLGKFADEIGLTASQVDSLSSAFKLMGSNADGAMNTLQSLSKMQSSSQPAKASIKQNLASEGLPSSIATDIFNSKDAYAGYIKLVKDGNKLTAEQQRRLLGVLGLNEKINLQMQQGPRELKDTLFQFQKLNPNLNKLAEESQNFNDQWEKLKIQVSDIGNNISSGILPPLTKALSMLNKFTEKHPKLMTGAVLTTGGLFTASATGAGLGLLHSGYKGAAKGAMKGLTLPFKAASKGVGVASKGVGVASKLSGFGILDVLGAIGMFLSPKEIGGGDLSPQEIAFNKKFNSYDNTPKNINLNVNLDGETIIRKVLDINNKAQTQTIHNIKSSVKG